ncbi:MAG: DoxX family protein [Hydrogenovibrio sp.]|uniref:HvfX family Cu-binding RiPP maturation protein n=1 Tax=Hydrogenovibrio sp. TaxID=2065821 RepID=UPI0028704FF6|nr:DoxX family protein [Hydrogenovibrio sp.]MDR9497886.1 DoxX family protein [Hydrogenovibrio sp.]
MLTLLTQIHTRLMQGLQHLDFLATLPLRIYLAAVFWVAGTNKIAGFEGTVQWFGNPDWGLGMPFPELMASLAIAAEVGGAVLLLLGLATRWATLPLIVTMIVAAVSVHWKNGWQAIHDPMSPWPSANLEGAMERLDAAKNLLQEHGHYDWLTETGSFVISNNGVEWAVTYLLMLLALLFLGGGRYLSLDYWIQRRMMKQR